MAKETMDKVVEVGKLEDVKGCQTDGFLLEGGDGWYPTLFIQLVQDYGVDVEVRVGVGRCVSSRARFSWPHTTW